MGTRVSVLLLGPVLFLPACRSPLPRPDPLPPTSVKEPSTRPSGQADLPLFTDLRAPGLPSLDLDGIEGDEVLARVGGVEIRKHHLLDRLREREPAEYGRLLELLILDQRVRELAGRLSVEVPAEELRLAAARDWARLLRLFEKSGRKEGELETWIGERYGVGLREFRQRNLRLAWRRLLRAYTLRYFLRMRGWVELRLMALPDRSLAEDCRRRVLLGASFEVLARRHSLDPSRKRGGRLPAMPLDHPGARLARGLAEGACSAVEEIRLPDGTRAWAFVRILDRSPPDPRPFAGQWKEIRRDLERRPVSAEELLLFMTGN